MKFHTINQYCQECLDEIKKWSGRYWANTISLDGPLSDLTFQIRSNLNSRDRLIVGYKVPFDGDRGYTLVGVIGDKLKTESFEMKASKDSVAGAFECIKQYIKNM